MLTDRLNTASEEITHIEHYDYVVVNKDIDKATEILKAILVAERWRTTRLDIAKITSSENFEFLLKKA